MMGVSVRALLAVGGRAAALMVDRGAPDFPVVQGMLALVATVLALLAAQVLPSPAAARSRKPAPRGAAQAGTARRGGRAWAP